MFRKATYEDIDKIAKIYDKAHTLEEQGLTTTGWQRAIYPTRETAEKSVEAGDMFVMETEGQIVACGRINKEQVDVYADVEWSYDAPDDEVMVLHTLVVDSDCKGKGYGTQFVDFYERYSFEKGCRYLRIDTNERNTQARRLYKKLGYTEKAIVKCVFNGIEGVGLVCIEKTL